MSALFEHIPTAVATIAAGAMLELVIVVALATHGGRAPHCARDASVSAKGSSSTPGPTTRVPAPRSSNRSREGAEPATTVGSAAPAAPSLRHHLRRLHPTRELSTLVEVDLHRGCARDREA
jgi:hypothetical protein